ncbi:unnamed protein product [Urochloa decumbens]|uniref:Uncharacterized protein n=1 Tax=Urochloa decumbens TaxID=240449 RepID=A0ABC8VHQ4_9POAL
MASAAAASRPPAPPPPPPPPPSAAAAAVQWLGPRVSFSLDEAGGAAGREAAMAAGGGKGGPSAGADFEFLLGGCAAASMLPADELFSGGKLVPLRIPAPSADDEAGPAAAAQSTLPPKQAQAPASVEQQQPGTPRAEETVAMATAAGKGGGEEPKIPARRWRDLLRLRKQQASSASGSGSATAPEPRPLRRLLRRGPKPPEPEPSLNLPLLREAGPDDPAPAAPFSTAVPPISTTSPSQQHQNLPPKIRLSPSQQQAAATSPPPPPPPPPPPAAVAADSPRLNAAGKVVFNGLGRSSSSPSSLAGGRRFGGHHRAGGAMERSYSAHVRVAPVLNVAVPGCSLRGGGSRKSVSVFGIDRLFSPSSTGNASASSSSSSAGGNKKSKAAAAAKKDATAAAASGAPQ